MKTVTKILVTLFLLVTFANPPTHKHSRAQKVVEFAAVSVGDNDDQAVTQPLSPDGDDVLNERLDNVNISKNAQTIFNAKPESPPPIRISRGPDGRLILAPTTQMLSIC